MMRAPAGRGLVAIGNAAGQLVLADPRTGDSTQALQICLDSTLISFIITELQQAFSPGAAQCQKYQGDPVVIDIYSSVNPVTESMLHMCRHVPILDHCQM